ncbi:MAG: TetR/AcrR family transcriptional regulator [Pseudomonadota bacterium]
MPSITRIPERRKALIHAAEAALKPTPKAKIPVTARGRATLRRILNAAEVEFGEKGYHDASVSSITVRANVGQGTFYLYFNTKEEVFISLVRNIEHTLRSRAAELRAKSSTRMELERRRIEAFSQFSMSHPHLFRIVQEAQFVAPNLHREFYERLATAFGTGLNQAAADGDLTPGDGETRAWALIGISHFLGLRHSLWQKKTPDPAEIDEVMRFISDGIAPKKSNAK